MIDQRQMAIPAKRMIPTIIMAVSFYRLMMSRLQDSIKSATSLRVGLRVIYLSSISSELLNQKE